MWFEPTISEKNYHFKLMTNHRRSHSNVAEIFDLIRLFQLLSELPFAEHTHTQIFETFLFIIFLLHSVIKKLCGNNQKKYKNGKNTTLCEQNYAFQYIIFLFLFDQIKT